MSSWGGTTLGALLGLWAATAGFDTWRMLGSAGIVAGLAAGGWVLGRLLRTDFCSDPRCVARLDALDRRCEACGGTVAGEIADASDRLAAEEALDAAWYEKHGLEAPRRGTAPAARVRRRSRG